MPHYCYSESIDCIKLASMFLKTLSEYEAMEIPIQYSRHLYKIVEML